MLTGRILVGALRLYQKGISPFLGPRCKYYPSCSEYAILAIGKYGPVRGVYKSAWRVLRCNPFSHGGVDYP